MPSPRQFLSSNQYDVRVFGQRSVNAALRCSVGVRSSGPYVPPGSAGPPLHCWWWRHYPYFQFRLPLRALLVLHSGITIYNGKRRLSSATNLRYFTSSQIRALSSTARSSTALLLELFRPFYLSRSLTGFILSGSYEFIKSSRKVRPALCEVKINVNAF